MFLQTWLTRCRNDICSGHWSIRYFIFIPADVKLSGIRLCYGQNSIVCGRALTGKPYFQIREQVIITRGRIRRIQDVLNNFAIQFGRFYRRFYCFVSWRVVSMTKNSTIFFALRLRTASSRSNKSRQYRAVIVLPRSEVIDAN